VNTASRSGPHWFAVIVVLACLMALSVSPSWAVTYLTVNGLTGGTITVPGNLVFRFNTASAGGVAHLVIGDNSDGDGVLDAHQEVFENLLIQDNSWIDEDSAPSALKFTWKFTFAPSADTVVMVEDSNGSSVSGSFAISPAPQSQSVSGLVIDTSGLPVAGAFIDLLGSKRREYPINAGADGTFSVPLPADTYVMRAEWVPQGNVPIADRTPPLYQFALQPGQHIQGFVFVIQRMTGPYTISGVVSSGGAPVAGAELNAQSASGERWASTDILGEYSLFVPSGTWQVHVESPAGYGPGSASVTVPPNKTVNFDLSPATNSIYGIVTDQGGAPVAGADVEAHQTAAPYHYVYGYTNALGRYLLPALTGQYEVRAEYPDMYLSVSQVKTVVLSSSVRADITLQAPSYTISGRVTRSDTGGPVALARVTLNTSDWDRTPQVFTDAQGYYSVPAPAGTFGVGVSSYQLRSGAGPVAKTVPPSQTANFQITPNNAKPVLSSGSVSPSAGPIGTEFVFRVTYSDANGDPPLQVWMNLDGMPYRMSETAGGSYTTGKVFEKRLTLSSVAQHNFVFGCYDTWEYDPVFPASGSLPGPVVGGSGTPTVSITAPANGATVKGTVNVQATASDPDGIAKVEFLDNGVLKYTDMSAPYSWSWDTVPLTVAEGAHTITARAYDGVGKTGDAQISVVVDNTTFDDVPKTNIFWQYIEALVAAGVTSGCQASPLRYCPENSVLREQMAKFICKAAGKTELKPATPTFSDVPKTNVFYGWIERLVADGVTSGCQASPLLYCPSAYVRRDQMAKFICKAAGKTELKPDTPTFSDVPKDNVFYGWIERLVADGVTSGCQASPLLYCPSAYVRRDQMAKFLVRAFGL